MTTYVHFGNEHAVAHFQNGEVRPFPGQRITEIIFPPGLSQEDQKRVAYAAICYHQGLSYDQSPTIRFVLSNDPIIQAALAEQLGITDNTVPDGYGDEFESTQHLQMPFNPKVNE